MKHLQVKNKIDEKGSFHISQFKERLIRTSAHKHDLYFEIILLLEGEGVHMIDDTKYVVSPAELYLLKPGQLHYWQFTSIPKGYVMLLREDEFNRLYEDHLLQMLRHLTSFEHARIYDPTIRTLFELIASEYEQHDSFSQSIRHGYLEALFAKMMRLFEASQEQSLSRNSLFQRFEKLIISSCPSIHRVKEFADLLCTTPQNLNAVCQKEANISASSFINGRLIVEAKRYLLHTDNSIEQVAELLNFSATSNFISFFKKLEGVTPAQYRRSSYILFK